MLHTLKGNARTLGLKVLAKEIHEVEHLLVAEVQVLQGSRLEDALAHLKSLFERYRHIAIDNLNTFQSGKVLSQELVEDCAHILEQVETFELGEKNSRLFSQLKDRLQVA